MDLRYERYLYFRRLGLKLGRGFAYFEPWHEGGSYHKQREDRYKNIDRATIRRPRTGQRNASEVEEPRL